MEKAGLNESQPYGVFSMRENVCGFAIVFTQTYTRKLRLTMRQIIQQRKERWEKCEQCEGEYFEGG